MKVFETLFLLLESLAKVKKKKKKKIKFNKYV